MLRPDVGDMVTCVFIGASDYLELGRQYKVISVKVYDDGGWSLKVRVPVLGNCRYAPEHFSWKPSNEQRTRDRMERLNEQTT